MELLKIIGITLLVLIATGALAWFGGGKDYFDKKAIENSFEKRNHESVERQYKDLQYTGKRALDFSPFETALAQMSDARIAEIDNLLKDATIPMIQELFAQTKLTSEELVLYYLHRIKTYDVNQLNSIIELNPETLEIARKRDEERKAGKVRGPLHGIPVTLKANIGTGDQMHTTAGAKALENARSDRDAFLVSKLREAGAIILGKNNLSEWANFMTSHSSNGFSVLGGQTKNPYGRFDVSGSSSGSAVSVAAHLVTVSVGTETSGSVIAPASQNSDVAIKPSLGLVSRDRIIPITDAMDSAGPIARSVTDMAILLNALIGVDPSDAVTKDTQALSGTDFPQYLDANGLKGMRIGIARFPVQSKAGDNDAFQRIIAVLKKAGAEVVKLPPLPLQSGLKLLPVLSYGLKEGVNKYLAAVGDKSSVKSLEEIIAFNKQDLANRAPWGQDLLEGAQNNTMTAEQYQALAQENRAKSRAMIDKMLSENKLDLLLTLNNQFSGFYASAGYPALTVSAGYRKTGEPVGATFVGKYLDEAKLIKAAYAFEQASKLRKDPVLPRTK